MESWTCSNLVGTLPEPCVFRRSFPATNGVRAKTLAEICPTNSDKIVRAELDRLSHRRHFHKTSAVLWHCDILQTPMEGMAFSGTECSLEVHWSRNLHCLPHFHMSSVQNPYVESFTWT